VHSASLEDLVCFIQDIISMLDEFVGVSREDEFPFICLICSIVCKELGLLGSVIVLPSVIRKFPFRMPSLFCCCLEVCFQVLVIALQIIIIVIALVTIIFTKSDLLVMTY
jgi:hypothetical protein